MAVDYKSLIDWSKLGTINWGDMKSQDDLVNSLRGQQLITDTSFVQDFRDRATAIDRANLDGGFNESNPNSERASGPGWDQVRESIDLGNGLVMGLSLDNRGNIVLQSPRDSDGRMVSWSMDANTGTVVDSGISAPRGNVWSDADWFERLAIIGSAAAWGGAIGEAAGFTGTTGTSGASTAQTLYGGTTASASTGGGAALSGGGATAAGAGAAANGGILGTGITAGQVGTGLAFGSRLLGAFGSDGTPQGDQQAGRLLSTLVGTGINGAGALAQYLNNSDLSEEEKKQAQKLFQSKFEVQNPLGTSTFDPLTGTSKYTPTAAVQDQIDTAGRAGQGFLDQLEGLSGQSIQEQAQGDYDRYLAYIAPQRAQAQDATVAGQIAGGALGQNAGTIGNGALEAFARASNNSDYEQWVRAQDNARTTLDALSGSAGRLLNIQNTQATVGDRTTQAAQSSASIAGSNARAVEALTDTGRRETENDNRGVAQVTNGLTNLISGTDWGRLFGSDAPADTSQQGNWWDSGNQGTLSPENVQALQEAYGPNQQGWGQDTLDNIFGGVQTRGTTDPNVFRG